MWREEWRFLPKDGVVVNRVHPIRRPVPILGSQDRDWEPDWVDCADDCGGDHGEGEEFRGDSYGAYVGYTQYKEDLGWGRPGDECRKYPCADEKWGWRGKGKERGKKGGKEKGNISRYSKGKGIGEGKKAPNQQATHFVEEKVEEAAFAPTFTAQDIHLGGAGSPSSLQDFGIHEEDSWQNGCGNGRPSPVVSEESGRDHGGTI